MKRYYLFLLLITGLSMNGFAQRMPDYGLNRVRLTDSDRTIVAEIIPVGSSPRVQLDKTYYWYNAGRIHHLQGGFSGSLLNGAYLENYPNKNLRVQGVFESGLKNGEWKEWDESGVLLRAITWKDGTKDGKFAFYKPDGSLLESGHHKSNELDGAITFYEGKDSLKVVHYKKGKQLPDDRRSFFKKINPFKKKTTAASK